jgi:hypothetical protein
VSNVHDLTRRAGYQRPERMVAADKALSKMAGWLVDMSARMAQLDRDLAELDRRIAAIEAYINRLNGNSWQ